MLRGTIIEMKLLWKKRHMILYGNSPIRSRGHGNRLGANLEWEQLARHDPGAWAPRAGEEEDVDTDESDKDFIGNDAAGGGADNCDDILADEHADGPE